MEAAETLNGIGAAMAPYGLKAAFHNHANEFIKIGDTTVYNILIENTDPSLVSFQFDVGWGQFAGADCPAIIRKYPGRFPLIHVKECDRIARLKKSTSIFQKRL